MLTETTKLAINIVGGDRPRAEKWCVGFVSRPRVLDFWARRVLAGTANKDDLAVILENEAEPPPPDPLPYDIETRLVQQQTLQRPQNTDGPGTQLKLLLQSLGFIQGDGCSCLARMETMDTWGLEGCRTNREAIIAWLRSEQANRGWVEKVKAGALAVKSGLVLRLNPLDPAPGLVDEALRRWEAVLASRAEQAKVPATTTTNVEVQPVPARERPQQQEGLRPYTLQRNGGGYQQNYTHPPAGSDTDLQTEGAGDTVTNLKWAYGVTCVQSRARSLLPRTLLSLRTGGFPHPTLFMDGCTFEDAAAYEQQLGLPLEVRRGRLGAYGNWFLALATLYIRNPACDRYAIFQDDFVTVRNLRQYLERCRYPDPEARQFGQGPQQLGKPVPQARGYWNLYTFPSNQAYAPTDSRGRQRVGWYESDQLGKGAVALVFSRAAVVTLLTSFHMTERVMTPGRGTKAIDGGVVAALAKEGWREYVHNPSLVQHTGADTTIEGNPPHLLAESFDEQLDPLTLLG